jgi:hypothetical protein
MNVHYRNYPRQWRLRVIYLTEPQSTWNNKAEPKIGEERAHYQRIIHRVQAPEALWDHGFEHTDEIRQNLARKNL